MRRKSAWVELIDAFCADLLKNAEKSIELSEKCKYCNRKAVKKIWIMEMGVVSDVCHPHFREYWRSRGVCVPVPILEYLTTWLLNLGKK